MTRLLLRVCLLTSLLHFYAAQVAGQEPPEEERKPDGKPTVVVFDFRCPDDAELGKFVARNLWAKLDRSGKFVLIDPEDFRQTAGPADSAPEFDGDRAALLKFAAEKFGATRVIWGKVGKTGGDGLKIFTRAASAEDDGAELLLDTSMEIKNRHEVQLATTEAARLFLGAKLPEPEIRPEEERAWETGPNLVRNPGFEQGTDHPDFWEPLGKEHQHGCVRWADSPEGKGKCIRFDIPKDVAASYGAAYYGDAIPIKDGTVYRFSVRVRSDGPTVKIFLKHYKLFPPGPDEKEGQWRETRRAPLNCAGGRPGEWQTYKRDFNPRRGDEHDPEITRVELYAYWPKGVVYFDDVVLKKLR